MQKAAWDHAAFLLGDGVFDKTHRYGSLSGRAIQAKPCHIPAPSGSE